MNNKLIFVTGFYGAPTEKLAEETAASKNLKIIRLDELIEKKDGRSVQKISMLMGEHEYRNKEYEALEEISKNYESDPQAAVILCGDGVLHDDMSAAIIKKHLLLIAGADMSADELWENAKTFKNSYYAFMNFGSDEQRRDSFIKLYERQCALFKQYLD